MSLARDPGSIVCLDEGNTLRQFKKQRYQPKMHISLTVLSWPISLLEMHVYKPNVMLGTKVLDLMR